MRSVSITARCSSRVPGHADPKVAGECAQCQLQPIVLLVLQVTWALNWVVKTVTVFSVNNKPIILLVLQVTYTLNWFVKTVSVLSFNNSPSFFLCCRSRIP